MQKLIFPIKTKEEVEEKISFTTTFDLMMTDEVKEHMEKEKLGVQQVMFEGELAIKQYIKELDEFENIVVIAKHIK
ncbi:hypothetical protein AAGG74_15130 [Bacillus mexicanus]|uniref:hypothetical protein n=1 Tax=Bacillus mexicanus TaxID=2834415 RepID=UPI003D24C42E